MPDIKLIGQVLIMILFVSGGNFVWKLGLMRIGTVDFGSGQAMNSLAALAHSPYMWFGGLLYGAGTLYWFTLLSRHPITYVYPMVGVGYVFSSLLGTLLLKESLSTAGWIGLGFMTIGFVLLSFK